MKEEKKMRSFRKYAATSMMAMALLAAGSSHAQTYPSKPIRIVVGEAPGTVNDLLPRMLAPHMSKSLGQPVLIENRPGAGQMISYEYVVRAEPDGYTAVVVSVTGLGVVPLTIKEPKIDIHKDIVPVIGIAEGVLALGTSSKKSWSSLREVLDYAKKNPGQLNVGTVSPTTLLASGIILKGHQVQMVPYTSGATYYQAAINGEIDLITAAVQSLEGFGDRIRILAVTGRSRLPGLPSTPTFSELGLPKVSGIGYSLYVRAGTPSTAIDKLYGAAAEALKLPEVETQIAKSRMTVVASPPAETARAFTELAQTYADTAKEIGMRPQ